MTLFIVLVPRPAFLLSPHQKTLPRVTGTCTGLFCQTPTPSTLHPLSKPKATQSSSLHTAITDPRLQASQYKHLPNLSHNLRRNYLSFPSLQQLQLLYVGCSVKMGCSALLQERGGGRVRNERVKLSTEKGEGGEQGEWVYILSLFLTR